MLILTAVLVCVAYYLGWSRGRKGIKRTRHVLKAAVADGEQWKAAAMSWESRYKGCDTNRTAAIQLAAELGGGEALKYGIEHPKYENN